MDIRGIWKIKEIRMPTPEGLTVITPDNLPEDERFEECVQRMRCYTEFADDGSLNTLILVPEELKAEAAEHGVVVREDGYAVIESTTWKEENGKFYWRKSRSVCGNHGNRGRLSAVRIRNGSFRKNLIGFDKNMGFYLLGSKNE